MKYLPIIPLLFFLNCQNTDTKKSDPRLFFYDGHYSIELPPKWVETENLNDQAILQIRHEEQPGYMIIIADDRIMDSTVDYLENSQLTRAHLKEALANYAEEGPVLLEINGYRAVKYEIHGHISDLDIRYWHVTVETDQYFLQCLLWSTKSGFWKNEKPFEKILYSLQGANIK